MQLKQDKAKKADTKQENKQITEINAILADSTPKIRHDELNSVQDYVKNKVPWAKADQNNEAKYDALNAISALNKGENAHINTEKLRDALEVLKSAEISLMTVKVFIAQARLHAKKLSSDHPTAPAMLGFAQGIEEFMDIVQNGTIGQMVKAIIPTYRSFKTNLEAIDPIDGTWTPTVSTHDQSTIDIATDYLTFLVLVGEATKHLPLKEKLDNAITGFIYAKLSKELNFEGHHKPYNKSKLFANSMIDNLRMRLKTAANIDFDMRFVDQPNAAIEHALNFVREHEHELSQEEINSILEPTKRVAEYARYEKQFGKTLKEELHEQRDRIEALVTAKDKFEKYSKHPVLNARKLKKVLETIENLDPEQANKLQEQRKKMIKPGITKKRKALRAQAVQATQDEFQRELENNKQELHGLIKSMEAPAPKKNWVTRFLSWLWQTTKEIFGVFFGVLFKQKFEVSKPKFASQKDDVPKVDAKQAGNTEAKEAAADTINSTQEQKPRINKWIKKPAASKATKRWGLGKKVNKATQKSQDAKVQAYRGP